MELLVASEMFAVSLEFGTGYMSFGHDSASPEDAWEGMPLF